MDDEEPTWQRQLAVGLGVLLAIGVLIGAIVAVVGLKMADYAGIGGSSSGSSTPEQILPTTGDASEQPPTTTGPPTPPPSTPPAQHAITLTASPTHAGSYEKVNLTGTYAGHNGATLQVQRAIGNGPWSDFPTTTHVSDGTFATYIKTGMTGTNRFRMLDTSTGKASNPATVTIG